MGLVRVMLSEMDHRGSLVAEVEYRNALDLR